jgi:hypothetical protein
MFLATLQTYTHFWYFMGLRLLEAGTKVKDHYRGHLVPYLFRKLRFSNEIVIREFFGFLSRINSYCIKNEIILLNRTPFEIVFMPCTE